jgi:hypothetical protein
MKIYRPLRISLFVYDLVRLILMIRLLSVFGLSLASEDSGIFPYLVYAVPQALFPLMTLFILLQFPVYDSYIVLYIAGKTIGIVSVFAWIVFSFLNILASLAVDAAETAAVLGGVLLLAATDALSIGGAVLLKNRLSRPEVPAAEGDQDAPEGGGI